MFRKDGGKLIFDIVALFQLRREIGMEVKISIQSGGRSLTQNLYM